MFGIEKDFQNLMEQVYGPLGEKKQMTEELDPSRILKDNDNEIEKTKKEIEVLTAKLALLEELKKTKSPVEEAFKDNYGVYPNELKTTNDLHSWQGFQAGYNAAYEEKVAQEPAKDVVSLYKRFVNESAYGQLYYDDAIKVVNDFLLDEGVIEDESGEYITFTLQKSLLEVPND